MPALRNGCTAIVLAGTILISAPPLATAQVNNPDYADYFLFGRFGEICTMCEAVVLCAAGDSQPDDAPIPDAGSFTLYHVQTRTFWSQIATIWEWFVANFDSGGLAASGHARPIDTYTVTDGRWSGPQTVEARVSLEPPVITIGDAAVDRVERRWLQWPESRPVGFCRRLPLWKSLDVIAQNRPPASSR